MARLYWVPKQSDFDRVKGKIGGGMKMKCDSRCHCTACDSCRCTPCHRSSATRSNLRRLN